jgi:hypothetical protein
LGIEVDDNHNSNKWAMFVRNWGNEGYCSSGAETLDPSINSFSFKIKHPGASSVTVVKSEFLCRGRGGSGPTVQLIDGEGALITFGFPPPEQRERINGIIELKWTERVTRVFPPKRTTYVVLSKAKRDSLLYYRRRNPLVDNHETMLFQNMTVDQKANFVKYNRKPNPVFDQAATVGYRGKFIARTGLNDVKLIRSAPDPERDLKDRKVLDELIKAYNGQLPKF